MILTSSDRWVSQRFQNCRANKRRLGISYSVKRMAAAASGFPPAVLDVVGACEGRLGWVGVSVVRGRRSVFHCAVQSICQTLLCIYITTVQTALHYTVPTALHCCTSTPVSPSRAQIRGQSAAAQLARGRLQGGRKWEPVDVGVGVRARGT
jgi:hypothetical protein